MTCPTLPGSESLAEVTATGQLLVELSAGGELEDDIDAVLVPEVSKHA